MSKKYKVYIYGCGKMYYKYREYFKSFRAVMEYRAIIVSNNAEGCMDGVDIVSAQNADFTHIDFIFVTSHKYWKEIRDNLVSLNVDYKKIIPCSVLELPYFDLEKYLLLRQQEVTILSNYCLGGLIYNELGLKILSPTVNMICGGKDFVKFCEDYDKYLSCDMEVLDDGYIGCDNLDWDNRHRFVPKGRIHDTVWNLVHAVEAEDGIEKWNTRRRRVNKDNVAIVMIIQSLEELQLFKNIKSKKKLGVYYDDVDVENVISLPGWKNPMERMKTGYRWHVYANNHMVNIKGEKGVINWINFLLGESDFYI